MSDVHFQPLKSDVPTRDLQKCRELKEKYDTCFTSNLKEAMKNTENFKVDLCPEEFKVYRSCLDENDTEGYIGRVANLRCEDVKPKEKLL
mmetsp:Transcript_21896/g.24746  ORF Transcript_21896/g.24746 Transcript_21896/m.24746 type:complete len:90 (-) Transcript_21896:43-312(-)